MEKILKQALNKAESAELFYADARKAEVQYEAGKLKMVNSERRTGAALRAIKGGRLGFASTTDFTQSERMVGLALDTATAGPAAKFSFPGQATGVEDVDTMKPSAAKLGVSEIVEMGAKFVEKLKKLSPECYPETSITVEQEKIRILNSSGLDYETELGMYSVYFGANVVKGSDVLMIPSFCIPLVGEYDADSAAELVSRKISLAQEIVDAETGPTRVLFSPMGMDSLLLPLQMGFNGKAVEMGVSPIKGLIGKKAVSDSLTVWNDPTVKYWFRSGGLDHEGMLTKKAPLISQGVIREPFYDLLTADMYGKRSTGSGYRSSFETPPSPSPSLISIEPGDKSLDELLELVGDGLLIEYCLGVGQGNAMAGVFSNNVGLGYRVKGGKIVGRVKNLMIAGNSYDLFANGLVAMSKERDFSMSMCLTPYMLIDGVSVTAKS